MRPIVLIVEDDAGIRRFLCTILRHATNATVADAADPFEASAVARALARPIDLLITDVDLGSSINGVGLARALSASHPGMKVLLMSARDLSETGVPAAWGFLPKPFPVPALLQQVARLGSAVEVKKATAHAA